METTTEKPDQFIQTEIAPLTHQARALVVTDPASRSLAVIFIDRLKDLKEKIEERFKPTQNKTNAFRTYEGTLKTEKAFYAPIDEALTIAKKNIGSFDLSESLRVRREQEEIKRKRVQKETEDREAKEAAIAAEEARIFAEAQEAQRKKDEAAKLKEAAIAEGNAKVAQIAAKEEAKMETKISRA